MILAKFSVQYFGGFFFAIRANYCRYADRVMSREIFAGVDIHFFDREQQLVGGIGKFCVKALDSGCRV